MKTSLFIFCFCAFCISGYSTVFTFDTAGDWTQVSNWDTYPGTTISTGDEVVIAADMTLNASVTVSGMLEINDGVMATLDWVLHVNDGGSVTNDGEVYNNGQVNLFGECVSNGSWQNNDSGTLIVTNTGEYFGYGDFVNNGSVLGYNLSYMYLEGSLDNNSSFSFNGSLELNHSGSSSFTNDNFLQFNGTLRLEGTLVNNANKNFNLNWSSTTIIADDSKIENYGTIHIDGSAEMSGLINDHSILGNIIVDDGVLDVKPSIPTIL